MEDIGKIHVQRQEVRALYGLLKDQLSHIMDTETLGTVRDPKVVEKLKKLVLDQFLERLMNSARYSVIVDNGDQHGDILKLVEDSGADDKIEPYDFALDDQLRDAYNRLEKEIEQVSQLRKETPQTYYDNYKKMTQNNEKWIDEQLSINTEYRQRAFAAIDTQTTDEDSAQYDRLLKDYETALESISQLKKDLPEAAAQYDNLLAALDFLNTNT